MLTAKEINRLAIPAILFQHYRTTYRTSRYSDNWSARKRCNSCSRRCWTSCRPVCNASLGVCSNENCIIRHYKQTFWSKQFITYFLSSPSDFSANFNNRRCYSLSNSRVLQQHSKLYLRTNICINVPVFRILLSNKKYWITTKLRNCLIFWNFQRNSKHYMGNVHLSNWRVFKHCILDYVLILGS